MIFDGNRTKHYLIPLVNLGVTPLFLIPAGILVICLFSYLLTRSWFESYFQGIEERTDLLQRVLYLVMTKDIVSFFASPDANRIVDLLFDEASTSSEDIEEKLLDSVKSAGPAIESLYASLKKAYAPSANINRARSIGSLLRLNIILYGTIVSTSEAVEIYFVNAGIANFSDFLNGLVFGGTIIFAVVLTSMALFIHNETRKVEAQMKKMSDPSSFESASE